MPTPDPGYRHYLRRQIIDDEPRIDVTERGFAWIVGEERHELIIPFCTVHVTPVPNAVLGEN